MTELASPKTRSSSDPLAEWALQKVRLDGRPFSFEGHEYLRAIYNDTAPHVVVSKAAQVGGTTWALLRAIHSCLNGLNVAYYFPTRTDVHDFSRSRVGPLIEENPFLAAQIRDTDTVGLKRLGDAILYFRGMQSAVGMKSIPADMLVFDELDEVTPEAKSMARERISHSEYKRVIELSNPSLPDYGIDDIYQRSDQRRWHLKCSACNEWTCLEREFPAKLNQEVRIILPREDGTYYRACHKCSRELDPEKGEWVADHPGRSSHGYRISQLFSARVDPGEILHEYQTTRYPQRFYTLKIGIPWADLESRLDVGTVLSLCSAEPMLESADGRTIMGVDTGSLLHVVILQHQSGFGFAPPALIHVGAYREFADLDGLMERFQVRRCVIDALPETHPTREFARRHRGKVFLSFFNEHQRGKPKWDSEERLVSTNRTEALDASRAAIRERLVILPRQTPEIEEFARHLTCDAKELEENPDTGALRYRYKRTGVNHYSMAFTYAWLAFNKFGVTASPEAVIGSAFLEPPSPREEPGEYLFRGAWQRATWRS